MGAHQLAQVTRLVGWPADQHLVEQAGQGVHIGGRSDRAAGEPLRCHVGARPDQHARHRDAGLAPDVGDAEVHQVGEVVGGEQDVLGLDVTVHQAVGMGGVQRRGHLRDDRGGPRRGQWAVGPQQLLDAGALDQPHVDVEHTVDLAEIVHRDHVRFLQPRRHPGLTPEPLLEARVCRDLGAQQFDRHHAFLDRVVGAVYLAHSTDTDQRFQLVGSEPGAEARGTRGRGHCAILSGCTKPSGRGGQRSSR